MESSGPKIRTALFQCMSCGKKYFTSREAEKTIDNGCKRCSGSNIDLFVSGEFLFHTKPMLVRRGRRA
jgi:hypothetical protein